MYARYPQHIIQASLAPQPPPTVGKHVLWCRPEEFQRRGYCTSIYLPIPSTHCMPLHQIPPQPHLPTACTRVQTPMYAMYTQNEPTPRSTILTCCRPSTQIHTWALECLLYPVWHACQKTAGASQIRFASNSSTTAPHTCPAPATFVGNRSADDHHRCLHKVEGSRSRRNTRARSLVQRGCAPTDGANQQCTIHVRYRKSLHRPRCLHNHVTTGDKTSASHLAYQRTPSLRAAPAPHGRSQHLGLAQTTQPTSPAPAGPVPCFGPAPPGNRHT